MKTYIYKAENGMDVRIPDNDEHMRIFNAVVNYLDDADGIRLVKKAATFETPLYFYEYKGVPFTMMFDEMVDETFFFVSKEYDYTVIQRLIESIEVIE